MPRKRTGKLLETEQLNVRLPVELVEDLHRAAGKRGWPLSKEIRNRLGGSFSDDRMRVKDPALPDLLNQIRWLSHLVRRHYGAGWHVDGAALSTFKEVIGRLVADLPVPAEPQAEAKHPPALVADVIYRGYIAERREYEQTGKLKTQMGPTVASKFAPEPVNDDEPRGRARGRK